MLATACAQPGSGGDNAIQSSVRSFPSCQVTVRFSGQPDEVRGESREKLHPGLGSAEGSVWVHVSYVQGVFRNEIAYCVCPSKTKSREDIVKTWRPNLNHKVVENFGDVLEFPMMDFESGKSVSRDTWVTNSACYLRQLVGGTAVSAEAFRAAASPFLSSAALIVKDTNGAAANLSSTSISQRLKQLEALRNEKLISEDEFKARRALIVEGL